MDSHKKYLECYAHAKGILEEVIALDAGSKPGSYGAGEEYKYNPGNITAM